MRYLLDTSAILAHYRQESGADAVQHIFEDREAEIVIASPTLLELARRLNALTVPDAEVFRMLETYQLLFAAIIAIDAKLAMAAYDIGRQTPQRLPLIDALIAAAAQMQDATLVHRDQHLADIPAYIVRQRYLA